MATKSGISLYTGNTPNGVKISIALEELGLSYTVQPLDMTKAEHKRPEYLRINPNGRIPAIVDHNNGDLAVWESGSILLYLADKYGKGKLIPTDDEGRSNTISWLMWQMSGQGPMQGQAGFFKNSFPIKLPKTIERFLLESQRLYGVLDEQLSRHAYVAGNTYSIADISCVGWAMLAPHAGIDLLMFPHVNKWLQGMRERPAVMKGYSTPENAIKAQRALKRLAKESKL